MENLSLLPLLFALLAGSPVSKAAPAAPSVAYVDGQFVGKMAKHGIECDDMTLNLKTSGAYPRPFKRIEVAMTMFATNERGQCVARFNLSDLPAALLPVSERNGSRHRVFTITTSAGKSDKLRMRYACTGAAGTPCVLEKPSEK